MAYAERNRLIKKVLSAEFGAGLVTVRGSRGTAAGWVTVKIDKRPADREERDAWKVKVWDLFTANGIKIGSYGTPGDMGCDYGWGNTIHIEFGYPLDEFQRGERVTWAAGGKVGNIFDVLDRRGWYAVRWDTDNIGDAPQEFYKRDLTRIEPGVKPRVRVPAGRAVIEEAPAWDWENDFNYVGSRHHY